MWVLKGVGLIAGIWAIFKLSGIAIEWLREGAEHIRPHNFK